MRRRPKGAQGTGFVGESVDKGLAAEALPAGQLDKPEAAIIDQPARPQRLDSGALQNHLRDLGFPPPSAVCGADRQQQTNPSAGRQLARAVEGLLHVMACCGSGRGAYRVRELRPPDCSICCTTPLGWSGGARTSRQPRTTKIRTTRDRDASIGSKRRNGQCVMCGPHAMNWRVGRASSGSKASGD